MEYYYLPRSHTYRWTVFPMQMLKWAKKNCTRLTIADLSLRAAVHLFLLIPGEHSNNCSLNHLSAVITAFACQFSSVTRLSGCFLGSLRTAAWILCRNSPSAGTVHHIGAAGNRSPCRLEDSDQDSTGMKHRSQDPEPLVEASLRLHCTLILLCFPAMIITGILC